ncbi:MAG: rRNA maturation RNase YbeY [Parcubacteria group bacterium]|nr:rRNA maturation RNase YbeY [Parcubacteria group bacterium]
MRNNTKSNPPGGGLPFLDIKNAVLGKKYDLSLVFIGSTLSRRLNKEHRKKDKPANILSFPLSEESGEIFIDIREAAKQAPSFNASASKFIGQLFIHGLFHLKGFTHGSRMEKEEEKIRDKFGLY